MKICGFRVIFDPRLDDNYAQARGLWPVKRIVVGPKWYSLNERERVAVLYHEAAHCRHMHMEQRVGFVVALLLASAAWPPLLIGLIVGMSAFEFAGWLAKRHEFQADRFAAEHGWGVDLGAWLARQNQPETDFYPSCAERARRIEGVKP